VTRTVIVDAVGLEENMIVEPLWPEMADARIYPDQPQGITRDDGQWVLGHKEFRYAVVPEKEGELVLPELAVEWWDTQTNQARTAVLAAHTIFVQPSALVPPPPPAAAPGAVVEIPPAMQPGSGPEPAYWRWLAILFAALWLGTLLLAWRARSRYTGEMPASGQDFSLSGNEAAVLSTLEHACRSGDRRGARSSLQKWIREFGPSGSEGSLIGFSAGIDDPELAGSIRALDAEGFQPAGEAGVGEPWSGQAFWKKFQAWRTLQGARAKHQKPPLSALYARENRPRG
jgi:hypothetical protein